MKGGPQIVVEGVVTVTAGGNGLILLSGMGIESVLSEPPPHLSIA